MPDMPTLLLAASAAVGALGLAIAAAAMLARSAEEHDLANRLRAVVRPAERTTSSGGAKLRFALLRPILRLGEILRDSAIISEREVSEFQRAIAAAGLDAHRAVPVFIGTKAVLLVLLPLSALAFAILAKFGTQWGAASVVGGLVLAVFGPNWVIGMLKRAFQSQLHKGLPDALDLMVVAAEAGLGLESAVDRVAREMSGSNRAIALELNILVQELRMLPDRRMALERMGERTDMDGFKRLGATLSQTLRYGTPLAQALRVLAADMRQERAMRIEEKAIRLPALLIGPLILFILPALFIALIGPSVLEMGKSFGGAR